jgi:predicted alpha-1,6-mannanase (GH76 family)
VELYQTTDDVFIHEDGILREPCELSFNCGGDGPQFKGIFMRNLGLLQTVSPHERYAAFIQLNATSIWTNARNDENQLGLAWNRRADRVDAARQTSALDALLVAIPRYSDNQRVGHLEGKAA